MYFQSSTFVASHTCGPKKISWVLVSKNILLYSFHLLSKLQNKCRGKKMHSQGRIVKWCLPCFLDINTTTQTNSMLKYIKKNTSFSQLCIFYSKSLTQNTEISWSKNVSLIASESYGCVSFKMDLGTTHVACILKCQWAYWDARLYTSSFVYI